MDDLISREAVINGIEELKKSPWANDSRNGYEYLIPEALGTVKDLCVKDCPSAFDGKTNGEVITTIYPNETMFEQTETCTYYGNMRFDTSWWNALYKAESEGTK